MQDRSAQHRGRAHAAPPPARERADRQAGIVPSLLGLQQSAGNQAVAGLVQREPADQASADNAPAAQGQDQQDAGPPLEDVRSAGHGRWMIKVRGYTEPGAVGGYLWPHGAPRQVEIVPTIVVSEPVQYGEFELRNVDVDAVSQMEPWIANWFTQAGIGTPEAAPVGEAGPQAAAAQGGQGQGAPRDVPFPDIKVEDENELLEFIEARLDNVHQAADLLDIEEFAYAAIRNIAFRRAVAEVGYEAAEAAAKEATTTLMAETSEAITDISGPIGGLALVILSTILVIKAFKAEKQEVVKRGGVYGCTWKVLGEPRHIPQFGPGVTYSAEELREGFLEGVEKGEAQADAAGKRIRAYLLAQMVREQRPATAGSLGIVVSEYLWQVLNQGAGHERGRMEFLPWPTPADVDPMAVFTE